MSLSSCCVSGHLHSGTPKGSEQTIGGLPTYVTGSGNKTVVFVTDIFGYKLNNVRILADEFADQGFKVVIPDLFDGDYVDESLLKAIAPQQSDPEPSVVQKGVDGAKVAASLGPWVAKHREAVTKPILIKFIEAVKAEGGKVGTVGFCWGGRYSILLCSDNDYPSLDAAVANHPSFLSVPDEVKAVNKPVLIQVGDSDAMLSADQAKECKEIFSGKADSEVTIFPGAVHGFTVRGDQNNEKEKQHKTEAADAAIKFLQKHLS